MLLEYPLIPSMRSHLISSRMLPGMPVRYSCCLHGPLYHPLHLGFACGGNRKHFITVVRLAQAFSTHLWDFGMLTCQLIFNNDSPRACLFLNDGKAA